MSRPRNGAASPSRWPGRSRQVRVRHAPPLESLPQSDPPGAGVDRPVGPAVLRHLIDIGTLDGAHADASVPEAVCSAWLALSVLLESGFSVLLESGFSKHRVEQLCLPSYEQPIRGLWLVALHESFE